MAVNSIGSQKTIQQIIDSTTGSTQDRKVSDGLGKDDFMNLLVTQLQYQDPLQPTDNTQFISQMAQFSALEQMQNLNTTVSSSKAFGMIGKYVTANVTDATTNTTSTVTGLVASVKMDSGKTSVVVNGQDIPIEQITDVTDGSGVYGTSGSVADIATYTNFIGSDVDASIYDGNTSNVVPVNGTIKSIQRGTNQDYAVMDGASVQISDVDVNSGAQSTDPDFRKNYLSTNVGKQVSVEVTDSSTGQKAAVTGVLKDYSIAPDGTITGTLDQVNVPVESISDVKPSGQDSAETTLLKEILAKLTQQTTTTDQTTPAGQTTQPAQTP